MRANSTVFAACLTVVFLSTGCAVTSAPDGWLPDAEQAQREAWGGWIEVTYRLGGLTTTTPGELIALDQGFVCVLSDSGFHRIPFSDIKEARVAGYDSEVGGQTAWMFAGMLSTVTHGAWLVISLPVWTVVGGVSVGATSREPMIEFPGSPLSSFQLYARFPQGLPPGLDPASLKRKPVLEE